MRLVLYCTDSEESVLTRDIDFKVTLEMIRVAGFCIGVETNKAGDVLFPDIWVEDGEETQGEILLACLESFLRTLKEKLDG